MRRIFIVAVTLVLVGLGGLARAQDVLVTGPGIKVGEATVLHPRLGVEAGVVSNVFFEATDEVASPVMRLVAGIDVAPAGEERLGDLEEGRRTLDFRSGATLWYSEYLSSNPDARAQRNLDADVHGNVKFFPTGNVSFEVADSFRRLTQPTNFESSESLDRDINHFRAEFTMQPLGHNISGGPRYENIIDVFEDDNANFANRIQHILGLRANWKFFPYTQAFVDGSVGFYNALGDNSLQGMPYKIESSPVRVMGGLDTVLTEWTTLNARLGYANGNYEFGPSYNSVIGGIQFGWRYTPVGRVLMEYRYDVNDSINSNYYGEHHFSLGLSQQIRTVLVTAAAGSRLRGYRGVSPQVGTEPNRDDVILEFDARAAWVLQDRYSLYVDYGLQSVSTDFRTVDGDDPSYTRHEAFLGIVAAF